MNNVSAQINLENITEEHEALTKSRNMMKNHYGISDEAWENLHNKAIE